MFRSVKPDTNTENASCPSEPVADPAELVPLSVLTLDLAEPPVGGWAAYLASRGVELTLDDLGRLAVSRSDARMLLAEKREAETRRAKLRAEHDRRAEQQDRLHRASLPAGIPAGMVPEGLTPAQGMMLADKSSGPQAKSVHEQLLERELGSGESMVFNSFGPDEE
jgi:hypothetical protein